MLQVSSQPIFIPDSQCVFIAKGRGFSTALVSREIRVIYRDSLATWRSIRWSIAGLIAPFITNSRNKNATAKRPRLSTLWAPKIENHSRSSSEIEIFLKSLKISSELPILSPLVVRWIAFRNNISFLIEELTTERLKFQSYWPFLVNLWAH